MLGWTAVKRLPIAIWVSSFDAGGTERQMIELIRGLAQQGYEVHAACFAARGTWLPAAAAVAASIEEFPISGFAKRSTWRQVRRYAAWCRRRSIHVVVTSDFYTNVFGLTGAAVAGVPLRIGGRREINTDKNAAKLALQRGAYALAHRVVANSRAGAARLRMEGLAPQRIAVVPNGVDTARFATPRVARPMTTAITIANLRAEKGHDVLIEAIGALGADCPELRFVFVGDGPCRTKLEQLAAQRGVGHRVRFLGERDDVPALLAAADLFVLPSRTEAFPNSVMEAMAAGLPVIASGVGGILELVEDGVSGVLVPPGDPIALARAIAHVAGDPAGAAATGHRAYERARDRFSMEQMVSTFVELLASELHHRRSGNVEETASPLAT